MSSSENEFSEETIYKDLPFKINPLVKRIRRIHSVTAFQFEFIRLASFYYFSYENNNIDVRKMAKNGYYYDRLYDSICCYFCGEIIPSDNNWDAAKKHQFLTDCPMNKCPFNGNVPLRDVNSNPEGLLCRINTFLRNFMHEKASNSNPVDTDLIYFNGKYKSAEAFSSYEERLNTFTPWFKHTPFHLRPIKERYAEAGFISAGFSDMVICFRCKGGLINLNTDDDPIKDHILYYEHCSFINEYYLKYNISRFTKPEQELLMQHPMIKHSMITNLDQSEVKRKILNFIWNHGCFPCDLEECVNVVEK